MRKILILIPIIFFYCCKNDNKKQELRQVKERIKISNLCDTLFNANWDTTIFKARQNLKRGQYFKFLDGLNFDNGDWMAVIKINHVFGWDRTDSNYLSKQGYYILTDKNILKQMQNSWTVKYLGGDCCTDDFCIYFIRNNKFVLGTGILLEGEEGFQNSFYGFTPIQDSYTLRKFFKFFRPCKIENDKPGGVRPRKTSP